MSRYALETLIVTLAILWLLGTFVYPVGGPVHLLLLLALFAVMARVFWGRRPSDRFP